VQLSQVQAYLASKITAAPALAALGDPFIYDPQRQVARTYDPDAIGGAAIVSDPAGTSLKDALRARLQATAGVTIEIDWPVIGATDGTVSGTFSRVFVPVFIAERAGTTHAPTGLALVDAVITALRTRNGTAWIVDVTDYAFDDDEAGSVLHIITTAINTRH
jgi:hypothetical protein